MSFLAAQGGRLKHFAGEAAFLGITVAVVYFVWIIAWLSPEFRTSFTSGTLDE